MFADDVGSGDGETVSNDSSLNLYKDCADRVLMPCDSEEFITVSPVHSQVKQYNNGGGNHLPFDSHYNIQKFTTFQK